MLRHACLRLCTLKSAAPAWSRGLKESTYLTGMDVDPDAWTRTPAALRDLQEYVRDKIPGDVDYRKHVEGYCSRFLEVIESSATQADAEETLGRQFEQIQEDVDSERTVINTMAQWQPWITAEGHAPKLFAELKDIPENVRAYREFQHEMGTK